MTGISRSAIFVSLAFHAGLFGLIGEWSPSGAMNGESGDPGVAASFLLEASGESTAAEPERALLNVPEFSLKEPDSSPVATAAEFPVLTANPPTAAAPEAFVSASMGLERPTREPNAAAKSGRATSRATVNSGASTSSTRRGSSLEEGRGSSGGAGYVPPQFRLRYKPPYPEVARAQRIEGTVLLRVSVDAAGRVTDTEVQHSCGHPLLDRAALESVRSWHFEPARQNGVATAAQVEVPVRFRFADRVVTDHGR